MFTPESMALQGYSFGYTKGRVWWVMVGRETVGQRGEGERLGKGAPVVKVGGLIFSIQEPGTQLAGIVVKVHRTLRQADPLMSMSPAHASAYRRTFRRNPIARLGQASFGSPDSVVGTTPGRWQLPFLEQTSLRYGRWAINQLLPLLPMRYSVDQDSGYIDIGNILQFIRGGENIRRRGIVI